MTDDDNRQEYEHIYMNWAGTSKSGKTNIYSIHATRGSVLLGTIKWFGRWRQYTFFPEPDTVYSKGCLDDISEFIRSL